jgi:ActR/RegA family two-component response regulator
MPRILLIGDDVQALNRFGRSLRLASHDVLSAPVAAETSEIARLFRPDVAVVDLSESPTGGIEVLHELRVIMPGIASLVVSDVESWDTAVEAMRAGARDWLPKLVSEQEIVVAVGRALSGPHAPADEEASSPIAEPYAPVRLAEKAVQATESRYDMRTLRDFGRAVGISAGGLRNWCRTARVDARSFRQFARALRAVSVHECRPLISTENILDIVDRRTLAKFLDACGESVDRLPDTVEDFLRQQRFVQNPEFLQGVRSALRRRQHLAQVAK